MNLHRIRVIALSAAFATILSIGPVRPESAAASCLPPDMQAFGTGPDDVVVAGHVTELRPDSVVFDVQLYWGPDPRSTVTIVRPETDPTVISSTDWNPTVGEPYIILATRDGDRLKTDVCDQLPGTRAAEDEVRSRLGDPVVPAAASVTPAASVVGSDPATAERGPGPPLGAVLAALVAAAVAILASRVLRRGRG